MFEAATSIRFFKPRKILPIIFILLVALFLRTWNLDKPDVSPDEYHYISDAHRFLTHDPYMSLRHHPFAHAQPNIGHPFLVPLITAATLKILGVSIFNSRLPEAVAGVLTIAVLFLFKGKMKKRAVLYAASILAVLPFMVRYNRDAHLDSVFTLWLTLIPVCIWRYNLCKNKLWLITAGITSALAFSTKLDGVFGIGLALVLLFFTEEISLKKNRWVEFAKAAVWIFVPFAALALLLNDPRAYLDGILNPSDNSFHFLSHNYFIRLKILPSLIPTVANYLISPLVAIFYLFCLASLCRKKDNVVRFLLLWQALLLGVILVHVPGLSGDWGWMPLIPPITLTIGYFLSGLNKVKSEVILALLLISIAPNLYMYGLRQKAMPYISTGPMNMTAGDTYFQTVMNFVNKNAPPNAKVYFLPPQGYTVYILRSDLSWSYTDQVERYNFFVVENQKTLESIKDKIKLISEISRFQDNRQYTAFIYKRTD